MARDMNAESERRTSMTDTVPRWKLEDAKTRLSELVRKARDVGPQRVTVRGRDAVVVVGSTLSRPTPPGEACATCWRTRRYATSNSVNGGSKVRFSATELHRFSDPN